jgi:outer membrane protein assembly factor BamB
MEEPMFFTNVNRIAILVASVLAVTISNAGDWYQYHGPNRDRISSEKGWNTNWSESQPNIAWKASVGTGFSSISVADGKAYTMGNSGDKDTIWCFDAKTGDEIWKFTYDCELQPNLYEGGPGCTPAIYEGLVYTISKEGHFYCLDANTGEKKWLIELQKEFGMKLPEWRFAVSPLIEGDHVVIEFGYFAAFDLKTGKLAWKSEKEYKTGYGSPIAIDMNGKRCFAGFNGFGLVIVDASNGDEISNFEWKTNYGINAATPIFNDGKIFLASEYGTGGGLIDVKEDGSAEELWHNRSMQNQMNASVLWDGNLFGFDKSNLRCIDFKTGVEKWMKNGLGKGSVTIVDGKLLILAERGDLVVAKTNPNEYEEVSRMNVLSGKCWTIPVFANQMIYCRNAAGDVVCVDVSK